MRTLGSWTALTVAASIAWPGAVGAQTLEEAWVQAYSTNPRLLSERAALRAADEGVPAVLAGWRPTVTVMGALGTRYQNNESANPAFGGSDTAVPADASIVGSQTLYRASAMPALRAAEARVMAARENLIDVEQQVLLGAGSAYMNVVRDQSVVDLNINNEQVLGRQLQATRDRFDVGEVTRTDVAQAEARLATASASRIEAEGLLEISRANYENLMGAVPGVLMFPDLSERILLPESIEVADAMAMARNPAILRAGHHERAATHDVSVAEAALLPTVTLDALLERQWEPNAFSTETETARITANVSVPLYQSGSEYSRIREARQTAVQRRRQLDEARRAAQETVSRVWETLVTTQAQIRAFQSAVRANEIALDGVEQEAAVGARTVLDVLDAEQELFQSRVNLVRSQAAEVVAAFEMLQVVGGLTAQDLELPTALYDPTAHFDDVRNKWIGVGPDFDKN